MGTIERAGDFHKNGAFRWDDVGIVPYAVFGRWSNFGLLEDGDFAGDGSFAVRVLRVWVSGIRQKRAVGFGGELELEVCAGCFDSAEVPPIFPDSERFM